MSNLEFKTTGDGNIAGGSRKKTYLSLITSIDGWKKSACFYREEVNNELGNLLLEIAEKQKINGTFYTDCKAFQSNALKISQVFKIEDEKNKVVGTGTK